MSPPQEQSPPPRPSTSSLACASSTTSWLIFFNQGSGPRPNRQVLWRRACGFRRRRRADRLRRVGACTSSREGEGVGGTERSGVRVTTVNGGGVSTDIARWVRGGGGAAGGVAARVEETYRRRNDVKKLPV